MPEPQQNPNVDAEQLATLAEGKVATAVQSKPGSQKIPGVESKFDTYTDDLERKKQEQAAARQEIKEERRAGADVDGSLGQGRMANEDIRDL
ncbi:hypothetical protein S40293_04967 [Stachybotrys chartarum IBT 40293]|nr:hypothetical protein S40293_04967 [Stachybotrys chartarum IBT 40293]